MDELIKQGQWWWLILPAVLALLGSWLGTRWGKTTEHSQWLRNQKIEVYTNLLRQIHASTASLDAYKQGTETDGPNLNDITDTTNARLAIVAPSKIRHLAIWQLHALVRASAAVADTSYDKERQAVDSSCGQLETAIRRDLGLIERDPLRVRPRVWFFHRIVYPLTDPFYKRYFRKHGHAWAERKNHRRP